MAFVATLQIAKFENFDADGDGFFSWKEVFPKIQRKTQDYFSDYKRAVQQKVITFEEPADIAKILSQVAQTPQAFSLGLRNASDEQNRPIDQPRRLRLGVF